METQCSHINRLPPEMLVAIFARLPVKSLVSSVSLVSHSWHRLTQTVRTRMRSLIVQVGARSLGIVVKTAREENLSYLGLANDRDGAAAIEARLQLIAHKALVVQGEPIVYKLGRIVDPPLSVEQSEWLVAHFPHITRLELMDLNSSSNAIGIHALLDRLCAQLHDLRLLVSNDNNIQLHRLLNSLTPDRFPRLKQLSLATTDHSFEFGYKRKLSLPILVQLDSFSLISTFNSPNILSRTLAEYAGPVNQVLRSIRLESKNFCIRKFVRSLKKRGRSDEATLRAIGARFQHITNRHSYRRFTGESARLLAGYFQNLTFLSIYPNHARQPIDVVFNPLAQLNRLKTLEITINAGLEQDMPGARTNSLLPLSSVSRLILCIDSYTSEGNHEGYLPRHSLIEEQLRPSTLLPNIDTVHCAQKPSFWLFSDCDDCGVHDSIGYVVLEAGLLDWGLNYFTEARMACLAALLAPFESCARLRSKAFRVKREEYRFRVPGWQCEINQCY